VSIVQLPDWLYIFVDRANPMAVINLEITGQYSSSILAEMTDPEFAAAYLDGTADFLPFVPNASMSTESLSPFTLTTISDYRIEYDAELKRRKDFKNAPSRMTGVFAFDSVADCRRVSDRFDWDLSSVQRFKPQAVLRVARVNMEIVSLARLAYSRAALDASSVDNLWQAYWGGEDGVALDLPSVDARTREAHVADSLWEWIIDGSLVHEGRAQE
jgi:hypothetical protein